MTQVNRYLKDKVMDRIDHALGRPLDPMQETYRNHYAVDPNGPECAEFRASPLWLFTGDLPGGLKVFSVTVEGRRALRDHLREIGDPHRAFAITFRGHTSTVVATSRAKARYAFWLDVSDSVDMTFGEFCRAVSVSALAKLDPARAQGKEG